MAIDKELVKGKILYTDSTHIRANASNSKYENEEYEEIITEDESLLTLVNEKKEAKGQKPLQPAKDKTKKKSRKVSKTDPDSGYMHRDRKPVGFYHLLHGTVDSSHNIILGLSVTPGNVHDATVYVDNLDNIFETFDIIPKYTGSDAGYFNLNVLEQLSERNLNPVIGPRKYAGKKGKKSKY
ncbi:MAG: transposase [Firmicutes bacterium]|nr:transposase [Bacillota bacterium]